MANAKNQALPAGTVLRGRVYTYKIEKVLGQGTFGITYLASTSIAGPLGKVTVQVALKEFFAKELDSRMSDGSVTARTEEGIAYKYARAFQRESENLSKMQHPGIVNVLEAFEDKGTYYYSMEYLSGGSLDDKVRGTGIPEEEALPLITKIGDALAYMHDRKVMHLDLKPKNIMLNGNGEPVIIDFGLSKQYDEKGEPESSSTIGLGTPGYAPIEQANQSSGRSFQPMLDIYALGATLYKMLTGNTPPAATIILNKKFPTAQLDENGVSAVISAAIRKAMSPLVDDRPQSVAAFLDLLHGEEEEETVKVVAPPPAPKPAPASQPAPEPGLEKGTIPVADHGFSSSSKETKGAPAPKADVKEPIRPLRLLGIIGSLAIIILSLFYFVIDNPNAHRCDTTFGGVIDYLDSDYVRLFMDTTYFANKTPYHYRNKWTFIRFEWEDAKYYKDTGSKTIDGCFFAPYWHKGEDVITDWCFWIPKDQCIEFEPGTTYKAYIYGRHDGIIFNRWARDIDFVFTFPSNPEDFYGQIHCEVK